MPPAAPMNIAGNTGPPRKLDSESAYASALQSTSSSSAPTDQPAALPISGPELVLAGEEHVGRRGGPSPRRSRSPGPPISEPQHGHQQHHARLDPGADGDGEELDPAAR